MSDHNELEYLRQRIRHLEANQHALEAEHSRLYQELCEERSANNTIDIMLQDALQRLDRLELGLVTSCLA